MPEQEKSITWVVGALMLLIAGFGWGFLAGSYDGAVNSHPVADGGDNEGQVRIPRRPSVVRSVVGGLYRFVENSLQQLPNLPTVLSWHFSNRIWLPMAIVGMEGLAVALGFGLKSLEAKLAKPHARKRRFSRPQ